MKTMNPNLKKEMFKLESTYRSQKSYRKLKRFTMIHLGGVTCVRCGYNNEDALCIDHIHNDGAQERRQIKSPYTLYRRIRDSPKDEMRKRYQVLCRNCNWLKQQERTKNELEIRRKTLKSKIREHEEMADHYRLINLPFGLDP